MVQTLKSYLPFLIALLGGIFFITLRVTGVQLTHFPGDLNDGRFCTYLLEHAYKYFTGMEASYWSAPFIYPEEDVISYSENLLGSAPFYMVFRFFGCDRELAFQCWFILVAVLNFSSCYLLLKYLFKNAYAAALGAMVFAFSLSLQCQMGHAQTFPRFAIPMTFLMGVLFLKELKPLYFFGAIFFVVYQIYCGIYIGFMLTVCMGLFFVTTLFFCCRTYFQKFKNYKWWLAMCLALVVNVLLLLPLILPYLERAAQTGYYTYEFVSKSLLTPKSFLFSWRGSLLWEDLDQMCVKDFGNYYDYQVFAGALATFALALFAVLVLAKLIVSRFLPKLQVSREVLVLFTTGLLIFLCYVRMGDFSFYSIIYHIPGFGSLRALQRIINIELLFYAVGLAFCFQLLAGNKKYVQLAFIACVLFFVADNYVQPDYLHRREVSESKVRVEALIEKIEASGSRKVLSYEPDTLYSNVNDFQLDAMLAAQSLGLKTLNGYTSTSPVNYSSYWSQPIEVHRMQWINAKNLSMDSVFVIK